MIFDLSTKKKIIELLDERAVSILCAMYAIMANQLMNEYSLCDVAYEAIEVEFMDEDEDIAPYIIGEMEMTEILAAIGFQKPKKTYDLLYWWSPRNMGIRLRKIDALIVEKIKNN